MRLRAAHLLWHHACELLLLLMLQGISGWISGVHKVVYVDRRIRCRQLLQAIPLLLRLLLAHLFFLSLIVFIWTGWHRILSLMRSLFLFPSTVRLLLLINWLTNSSLISTIALLTAFMRGFASLNVTLLLRGPCRDSIDNNLLRRTEVRFRHGYMLLHLRFFLLAIALLFTSWVDHKVYWLIICLIVVIDLLHEIIVIFNNFLINWTFLFGKLYVVSIVLVGVTTVLHKHGSMRLASLFTPWRRMVMTVVAFVIYVTYVRMIIRGIRSIIQVDKALLFCLRSNKLALFILSIRGIPPSPLSSLTFLRWVQELRSPIQKAIWPLWGRFHHLLRALSCRLSMINS